MSRNLIVPPSYGRRPTVGLASSGYSPSSLNLVGWWRSDNLSNNSLSDGANMTVGGVTVLDNSGVTGPLGDGGGGTATIFKTNQLNGKPSLQFDGVGAAYGAAIGPSGLFSFITVIRGIAFANAKAGFNVGDSSNLMLKSNGANIIAPNSVSTGVANNGAARVISLVQLAGGTTFDLYVDTTKVISAGGSVTSTTFPTAVLGADNNIANFGNVDWFEAIVWNRTITLVGDVTPAVTYLKAKYNI
jgi:hypothetical protein